MSTQIASFPIASHTGTVDFPQTYTAQATDKEVVFACAMNLADITTPGKQITLRTWESYDGGATFPASADQVWNSGPEATDKRGNPLAPWFAVGVVPGNVYKAAIILPAGTTQIGGSITAFP